MIESVKSAIFTFPYDVEAVPQIANLREGELDQARIVRLIGEAPGRSQSDAA